MADDHMDEEREFDLSDGATTDKYKAAGEIANSTFTPNCFENNHHRNINYFFSIIFVPKKICALLY